MTRRAAGTAGGILCFSLVRFGAFAAADDTEPGVTIESADGVTRLDAVLPGRLVSYALPSRGDGRREILLLVAPASYEAADPSDGNDESDSPQESGDEEDGSRLPPCPGEEESGPGRPMALYRLVQAEPGRLVLLNDDLPHDCTALDASDPDGDGIDELLLARPGEIFRVEPAGLVRVLEDPDVVWKNLEPQVTVRALEGRLVLASVMFGTLRIYGPPEGREGWEILARVDLPLEGRVGSHGLSIDTANVSYIGQRDDGTLLFATRPEPVGKRRLQTLRIEVDPAGGTRTVESWGGLPEPEELIETDFLWLDGKPILFVGTVPAGRFSLFGEKGVRLFALERDRSRLGLSPLFATRSRMNLWQDAHPVVLDAYLRGRNGAFEDSPRTTAFNVEDADRTYLGYGSDLNGDGLPDLCLLRTDGALLLYPGLRSTSGKKLVNDEPRELAMGEIEGEPGYSVVTMGAGGPDAWSVSSERDYPRHVDLEGDGASEIVRAERGDESSPGVFRAVWWNREAK